MSYFSELQGQKVIVTGGGKGIGRDIALAFAQLGANVVITGRDETVLSAAAEELRSFHPDCSYIVGDIQNVTSVYEMVDEAVSRMGGVDVLVNNAGINIPKPALEVTEEDWDRVLDTNLKGTFFCAQRAGQHMISQGSGRIIILLHRWPLSGISSVPHIVQARGELFS